MTTIPDRWPTARPSFEGNRWHLSENGYAVCSLGVLAPGERPSAELIAEGLLCRRCAASAARQLRGLSPEEVEALTEGAFVRRWGGQVHRVTLRTLVVRRPREEPPITSPEVACNGHDVDHHRALYRLEPEPPEADLCRRCWPKSGPKVDLDLPTPAPRAKLGEVVTLGGVTGAYLRPVPGGHELRTWQGDRVVLEGTIDG